MSLGFDFTSSLISFVISFLTVILFFGSMYRFNEGSMKTVLRHFFYSLLVFSAGQFFILAMVFLDYQIDLIYGIRAFFVIATAIGFIITSFEALKFAKRFGMKNKRLFS